MPRSTERTSRKKPRHSTDASILVKPTTSLPPGRLSATRDAIRAAIVARRQSKEEVLRAFESVRVAATQYDVLCKRYRAEKMALRTLLGDGLRRLPLEILRMIFLEWNRSFSLTDPADAEFDGEKGKDKQISTVKGAKKILDQWSHLDSPAHIASKVCRLWRSTALSISELWSTIIVPIPKTVHSAKRMRRGIRLQLERSKTRPLRVMVHGKGDEPPRAMNMIMEVLALSTDRWQDVLIQTGGDMPYDLLSYLQTPTPLLESIKVAAHSDHTTLEPWKPFIEEVKVEQERDGSKKDKTNSSDSFSSGEEDEFDISDFGSDVSVKEEWTFSNSPYEEEFSSDDDQSNKDSDSESSDGNGSCADDFPYDFLCSAPLLKSLSLIEFPLWDVHKHVPHFPSLIELNLKYAEIDSFVFEDLRALLQNTPVLERLDVDRSDAPDAGRNTIPASISPPVVLPSLRSLAVDWSMHKEPGKVFIYPSLRHFALQQRSEVHARHLTVSSRLESLELDDCGFTLDQLTHALRALTSLTSLTFRDTEDLNDGFCEEMMKDPLTEDQSWLCPNLERLSMIGCNSVSGNTLVRLLRSRTNPKAGVTSPQPWKQFYIEDCSGLKQWHLVEIKKWKLGRAKLSIDA